MEEFAEKGLAAARIEDIAGRAKVGKGTVYLYFDDKEALFEGLIHELIGFSFALHEGEPRPGEKVGAFLRRTMPPAIAQMASSRRADILRLLIGEGARFPRLADSYRKKVLEPTLVRVRALAAQALEEGQPTRDALLKFPQLLVAPSLLAIVWSGLFARAIPLDVQSMLETHLSILFPKR